VEEQGVEEIPVIPEELVQPSEVPYEKVSRRCFLFF
jgi:hypothetical protein